MNKALIALWLTALFSFSPPTDPIRLRSESLPFTPKEFYVANVTDDRSERGPVARLALVLNQPVQPVDLAGGVAESLLGFTNQSLRQNRKLRPIAMRVLQLRVIETAVGNRVTGKFTLSVAYDLIGKNDDGSETSTRLTTYRGGTDYVRPLGQTAVVESSIRQTLVASLRSLNEYMNRESGRNEKLASGLRVNFTDVTGKSDDDDTVWYNPVRKLTWTDFRADPRRGSHYAAEVFTSFAYEGGTTVVDGIINVNLTLKCYMLKHSSWGRADARTLYALNHEQRHFDITRIVTEQFKRRIQPDSLTLDDYNSIIQYQFIEAYRDMNRMQEQYDSETNHGLNQMAQERWNQRIDETLRSFGQKK